MPADDNIEVRHIGTSSEATTCDAVISLARRLSHVHGLVKIANERSGAIIYIPDPMEIERGNLAELDNPRLAICADRYLGTGMYDFDKHPTEENRKLYRYYRQYNKEVPSASSMKSGKTFSVDSLLHMENIEMRLARVSSRAVEVRREVRSSSVAKNLVQDKMGVMVPVWCGQTTPLTELPDRHPARDYLLNRGYSLEKLQTQFNACYCHTATPEDREEGRVYSRNAGGMKNTPQGRIIFSCMVKGSCVGWQGRIIDIWHNNTYFVWSDKEQWLPVRTKQEDGTVIEHIPPTSYHKDGFKPYKYVNAIGSRRNEILMGFDAAVQFNAQRDFKDKYCVLVEGPLDAARIGPPAIAILGSAFSAHQADLIRRAFGKIVVLSDNDEAGQKCRAKIVTALSGYKVYHAFVPSTMKDVGEMQEKDALKLIEDALHGR